MKAVIFDMDGVIVDSEPSWRQAEIEVFAKVGLTLTEDDCLKTLGLRIDEVTRFWYRKQPWKGISTDQLAEDIVDRVIELVEENGAAMAGFYSALDECEKNGKKLAVASSSPERLIKTTLNKLGVSERFQVICSAENEVYGKPHPAVFIRAAEMLNIPPEECLVIEDSPNGVIAARAALMKVIAVPEDHNKGKPEFACASAVLDSLEAFKLPRG